MPGPGQPVGEPGGRVEEHQHRVEVAVGGRPPPAAPGARGSPPLGQAAGPPDRPQHVLGGGRGAAAASRAVGMRPAMRRAGTAQRSSTWPARPGSMQRLDQQLARGPVVADAGGQLRSPWRSRRSDERVGPAQRRVQQLDRRLFVQSCDIVRARSGAAAAAARPPAGWPARCPRRPVVSGTPAWVSARRSAAWWCCSDRTITAIRDHGDAVVQVGLAQPVGDVGGLAGQRAQRAHLDASSVGSSASAARRGQRGECSGRCVVPPARAAVPRPGASPRPAQAPDR